MIRMEPDPLVSRTEPGPEPPFRMSGPRVGRRAPITEIPVRSKSNPVVSRRGMTLTEIMAVIGIIVVLLAILLPGLATVRRTGEQTTSENNLRQLYTYIKSYMTDNREFVPPSSFDYRNSSYPGIVRTNSPRSAERNSGPVANGLFPQGDPQHVGSWADVIWTYSELHGSSRQI